MDHPERIHITRWIKLETRYADSKFGDQRELHDREMRDGKLDPDGFWYRQIHQYIDRVRILGIENPQGRQTLAKSLMTMRGSLESAVRVYGPLPTPGLTSGEIREWGESNA